MPTETTPMSELEISARNIRPADAYRRSETTERERFKECLARPSVRCEVCGFERYADIMYGMLPDYSCPFHREETARAK